MNPLLEKYARLHPMAIAVLATLFGLGLYFAGFSVLDRIELDTVDLRFQLRGTVPTSDRIVLAVIDEKSIAKEGKWVWPRTKFVTLIDRLSEAGAKVIAFDIGFLEEDTSDEAVIRTIETIESKLPEFQSAPTFGDYLHDLKRNADRDRQLAEAIRRSSAKVVLGYFFHTFFSAPDQSEAEQDRLKADAANSEFKIVKISENANPERVTAFKVPQSNVSVISESTDHAGFFNIQPDRDGAVRGLIPVARCDHKFYAPLSLMTASAYLDAPLSVSLDAYGVRDLRVGSLPLPLDSFGKLLINYRGGVGTFPHVSITDILNGDVSADRFRDKIVLVGATAIGIYDMRVTPMDTVFPGLEVHATVVDNILTGRFLTRPDWLIGLNAATIILAAAILGWLLPRMGLRAGTMLFLASFTGYVLWVYALFVQRGLVANMIYPLLVMVLMYVGITIYQYFMESRQKRFIKDTFGHYLAPSVIQELLESPDSLVLGGEERVITAFFSDLQGFTSISESLEAGVVVELLNEFLTEMTDIILNYKGTVDKFEGDAIIAFFGAPKDIGNHALAACRAALDMQKRLADRRDEWEAKYQHRLKMRIGMMTGPAVVGNMGSRTRMDYTMMGDTVNTAARLEGINKFYGTGIMIGESTRQAIAGDLVTREIDQVQVIGKKIPVTTHEVVGYVDEVANDRRQALDKYAEGLRAFRSRRWDPAIRCFEAALALSPEDGPGQVMLERSREYLEHPPEADWDGVFRPRMK